jgi:hypothetical protein
VGPGCPRRGRCRALVAGDRVPAHRLHGGRPRWRRVGSRSRSVRRERTGCLLAQADALTSLRRPDESPSGTPSPWTSGATRAGRRDCHRAAARERERPARPWQRRRRRHHHPGPGGGRVTSTVTRRGLGADRKGPTAVAELYNERAEPTTRRLAKHSRRKWGNATGQGALRRESGSGKDGLRRRGGGADDRAGPPWRRCSAVRLELG